MTPTPAVSTGKLRVSALVSPWSSQRAQLRKREQALKEVLCTPGLLVRRGLELDKDRLHVGGGNGFSKEMDVKLCEARCGLVTG